MVKKLITIQNDSLVSVQSIPDDTENIKTFIIEGVPEITYIKGKIGKYVYNPDTKMLDIVYEDAPLTEIDILKQENEMLAETLDMILSEIIPSMMV